MKGDIREPSLISPNATGLLLVVIALVVATALGMWIYRSMPNGLPKRATNFPPGWDCEHIGSPGAVMCDRNGTATKPPTTKVEP